MLAIPRSKEMKEEKDFALDGLEFVVSLATGIGDFKLSGVMRPRWWIQTEKQIFMQTIPIVLLMALLVKVTENTMKSELGLK